MLPHRQVMSDFIYLQNCGNEEFQGNIKSHWLHFTLRGTFMKVSTELFLFETGSSTKIATKYCISPFHVKL